MAPYFFPRTSISKHVSFWVFFIVSTSIFRSWMVLFNSITCFVVFSFNSLRDFCVSSLRTSTCLVVFSCNSLRTSTCLAVFSCISLNELLMPFLKSSTRELYLSGHLIFLSVLFCLDPCSFAPISFLPLHSLQMAPSTPIFKFLLKL